MKVAQASEQTTAASRATISEPRCYDTAIVFMLYAEGGMTKHDCTLLSTRRVPPSEYAACSLWWTVCVPKILKHYLVVFPRPTALLGLSSSSFFRENRNLTISFVLTMMMISKEDRLSKLNRKTENSTLQKPLPEQLRAHHKKERQELPRVKLRVGWRGSGRRGQRLRRGVGRRRRRTALCGMDLRGCAVGAIGSWSRTRKRL
jgi:hypothetical protein